MSSCQTSMKCPRYEAAEARLHPKASPRKEPPAIKPPCPAIKPPCPAIKPPWPPTAPAAPLSSSLSGHARAVHDKENSADGPPDEGLEDSGYLSLHNSQLEEHPGEEEEDRVLKKTKPPPSPRGSPSKCQGRTGCSGRPEASTPVDRHRRRTAPADRHREPNLPILKFQRAVCEELSRSYQRNKRYDWSVVAKVAEHHFLDRVIGGKMGREHVDVFSGLLSRNMWSILSHILSLLGDLDLLSCQKVSRTWRRITCEDRAARSRCQRAEQLLRESSSSLGRRGCGLTRDVCGSRLVLSGVQPLACARTPPSSPSSSSSSSSWSSSSSSSWSSSSTPSCGTPTPPCSRFNQYLQAASGLQHHESLRSCRRCGSPATLSSQRVTCTRPGCRYSSCGGCGAAVHGSAPCRAVRARPPATPVLPGARSKRSVRRL